MQPTTIQIIEDTWAIAATLGVDTIGVVFYKHIFKLEPELLKIFSFKDQPDMFNSEKFKVHAAKVVTTLAKAVGSIRDLPALVPVLRGLGKRHVKYGVTQEHYPIIGSALMNTLSDGLGDKFTDEAKAAWQELIGVVAATMLEGANSA